MGLELYYHASQEPFTNVLFANVVGREDLSGIDMAGWNVKKRMAMYETCAKLARGRPHALQYNAAWHTRACVSTMARPYVEFRVQSLFKPTYGKPTKTLNTNRWNGARRLSTTALATSCR